MPMYEYRCQDCGERFEALRKASEADQGVRCPQCQGERIERLLSGFATSGCGTAGGGSRGRFR
jgi:putative FmdB family regulatory protein